MRTGLVVSIIGHVVVLCWGLIAFPSAKPYSVEPVDALPVDLVPIEEITKTRIGDKTASKDNAPAPAPAEKPTEATEKAPDPGKKPAKAAKPSPAKAEPAPQAEPEAEKEPAPAPQVEPAPAEEPAPEKAEAKEETPEPPKPVKVVPQSKPTPPKHTRTTAAQPIKNRQEPKKKDTFDPNEISNLLSKVEPEGGTQTAVNEPAGLGANKATQQQGLSASDLDLLVSEVKERWNYVPDTFPPDLVVRVQFQLSRDGHLIGTPQIMNSHPYPRFRQLAEAAIRAIIAVDRSEGFSFLPRDCYEGNGGWNTVLANLKPQ
ncbi:cell envelope biogenesis protein TolA [Breoghania sp.]|uniref:cell envelope biogenesis protein TolA n=1 Tax=Breoghania sp. TaxID=2065378 RepID=UPI0026104604|nr:cell envelope biogenesis protein TolA [Breoghania sp.]MDJ0931957.1 cell envelope biogenesis protein TolA [Breoghania sp.]